MELSGHDRWLEAPYQRSQAAEPPDDIEEMIGQRVTRDGYDGVIEDFGAWTDEDEDGKHGGIDLVVRFDHSARTEQWPVDEAALAIKRARYAIEEREDGTASVQRQGDAIPTWMPSLDVAIDWIEEQIR